MNFMIRGQSFAYFLWLSGIPSGRHWPYTPASSPLAKSFHIFARKQAKSSEPKVLPDAVKRPFPTRLDLVRWSVGVRQGRRRRRWRKRLCGPLRRGQGHLERSKTDQTSSSKWLETTFSTPLLDVLPFASASSQVVAPSSGCSPRRVPHEPFHVAPTVGGLCDLSGSVEMQGLDLFQGLFH